MSIRTVLGGWSRARPLPKQSARAEAERLIAIWGETAVDVARNLSVREEAGLLHTASPGFWAHVGKEIGQQTGAGAARPA